MRLGLTDESAEILWNPVKEEVAKEGIDLEYVVFGDYTLPNSALANGEIELNSFQHYTYRVANYLNRQGFRAHFFPRDCYGDISVLVKKPEAAFSHVIAGKYAGLGTIGMNHTLLTKAYGPPNSPRVGHHRCAAASRPDDRRRYLHPLRGLRTQVPDAGVHAP